MDQLSVQNGHHEFEHLCRHLARRTICTNILPATDPISAGGDQGRDFETFRTYIRDTNLRDSAFVGSSAEGVVAFACTLQRKNIDRKVKSDVQTILASGVRPDSVYMFLSQDLVVARRHVLQTWAKEEFGVLLEILDGQAIAEALCDPELFWIAEGYLAVPREFRPERNSEAIQGWYREALERWKDDTECTLNPANFHELASAIRHATFSSEARSDVPLWIERLEQFRSDSAPEYLSSRATYEIAVASLRGLGTMQGREDELREYFTQIEGLESPAAFEDMAVLLGYCYGAFVRDAVQLTLDELRSFQTALFERLNKRLADAESVTTKCALLHTKGYASFFSFDAPDSATVPDLEESVICWTEMLELVSGAPLFPLERFADHLTEMIRLVGDFPGYSELANRVDELLSTRSGGFFAAEKCRDRAIAFHKTGHRLRAIQELHKAKIGWFADETLHGAILAMLLIAEWYRELGLAFAAKQYAMAAAFVVIDTTKAELKRYAPQALLSVAECDYQQGNWCDFIARVSVTLWSHHLVPNQDESEEASDRELDLVLFYSGIILMVCERFAPAMLNTLQSEVEKWGLEEYMEEVRPMARKEWAQQTDDELWSCIESELQGRPFGDVGSIRTMTWRQLGVRWEIECSNKIEVVARAEQFIASAQIFMAEWAGLDLCLLRTNVKVEIRVDDTVDESKLEAQSSNSGRVWILTVPVEYAEYDVNTAQQMAVSHAIAILSEVSLLPEKEFFSLVEETFKAGVMSKVFVARAYHELYLKLTALSNPFESKRAGWSIPEADRLFEPKEHEEMGWFDGPASGYSEESAKEAINNRYERGMRPIRITIARLCKDDSFRESVEHLREDGWLDWHFVVAITNIVLDVRVGQPGFRKGKSHEQIHKDYMDTLEREETFEDIWVPNSAFTEEAMRQALTTSSLATLKSEGFECRQLTPDLPAIDDFLRHRMGYWSDDVDHEDIFS